jgi:hypothetical protein
MYWILGLGEKLYAFVECRGRPFAECFVGFYLLGNSKEHNIEAKITTTD